MRRARAADDPKAVCRAAYNAAIAADPASAVLYQRWFADTLIKAEASRPTCAT